MNIKITKEKPIFSDVPHGKRVVMVQLPCGCDFKWVPTYKDMANIINALTDIEEESWAKR